MTSADLSALLALASWVAAVAAAPVWLYLGALALLSWARRAPAVGARVRLVAVVPAHNEELGIGSTVASLLAGSYPQELRRVVVIADNCSDTTADKARAAGATVLERTDTEKRGKGYALEVAFAHVLADPFAEGVMVIDADTVVADNLWEAMAARIAQGDGAIQSANRVRNRDTNTRTRLLAIALAMINGVRCLGRERLGLSVGLKGNGMCFARATLEKVPHTAYGLVEDVEYAVKLALAGVRVVFAAETWIASESPETKQASLSQRRRWEGGRIALIRNLLPRVLKDAVTQGSAVLLDIGLELLIPPITYPGLLWILALAVEGAGVAVRGAPSAALGLDVATTTGLLLYVGRGWMLSGTGARGLFSLLTAPAYVAWKIFVAKPWQAAGNAWVRTKRVGEK